MRIFINPGHCPGADPGCINKAFDVCEAEYVWEIGQLVRDKLKELGHSVKLLQTDNLRNAFDDDKTQPCIVDEANEWCADIAVSIHCDAFNGIAHGTGCFCFARGSEADRLAHLIQYNLVKTLGTMDRGVRYEQDKEKDKRLSFCMLTEMPAVVVECAFLDNFNDAVILLENKEEVAEAICKGITEYAETA